MSNTKKIYIINGVTGNIGSSVFTYLVQQDNTIVYGISRKGLPVANFITDEKLPDKHLVFSLGDYENERKGISELINYLPYAEEIIFLHLMGVFVTEINRKGDYEVSFDNDNDGINDKVKLITEDIPTLFATKLAETNKKVIFLQLGSLSDKHMLKIHNSWVQSISNLKERLKEIGKKYPNFKSLTMNVSSVLTPKELIERPFVTIQTNADPKYWLDPSKIGEFIYNINHNIPSYSEESIFKKWPNFDANHFQEGNYIERRRHELFKEDFL
jgi:hypothetical protein